MIATNSSPFLSALGDDDATAILEKAASEKDPKQ